MPKPVSQACERIMNLKPGRSTVVSQIPVHLIQTAVKYTGARYSYRRAEGHFVVVRTA